MSILSRKTPFILLVGDLAVFVAALWVTLLLRYLEIPIKSTFLDHIGPFIMLFAVWVVVYFIMGLYEKKAVVIRSNLAQTLVYGQLINAALSVTFFYLAPFVTIAPKTNLFLYLLVSTVFIIVWRVFLYPKIIREKREQAVLIGSGREIAELLSEVNGNPNYHFSFIVSVDLDSIDAKTFKDHSLKQIEKSGAGLIIIDLYNEKVRAILPDLYNLLLKKVSFIDMHRVYENVFGREALSLLNHSWFLENISTSPKYVYDAVKRAFDFVAAVFFGLISLAFYPFAALAIKMEDGGPVFIIQERVGKDGKIIRIPKFRSMKQSDKGAWVKENDDRITKTGKVLRKTRIDELPQLWSVLKGDMSLVGPRPDIYDLGVKLSQEIPYYTARTVIKPGLSGWAQIRQELPPQSLEETKIRLAYDFYYIKNRSLGLDVKIALQTLSTLASRGGK